MLNPYTCLEDVSADGSNTIFLVRQSEIDTEKFDLDWGNTPNLQSSSDPDSRCERGEASGYKRSKF